MLSLIVFVLAFFVLVPPAAGAAISRSAHTATASAAQHAGAVNVLLWQARGAAANPRRRPAPAVLPVLLMSQRLPLPAPRRRSRLAGTARRAAGFVGEDLALVIIILLPTAGIARRCADGTRPSARRSSDWRCGSQRVRQLGAGDARGLPHQPQSSTARDVQLVQSEELQRGIRSGTLRKASSAQGATSVLIKDSATGRIAGHSQLKKVAPKPASLLGPAAWQALAMATQQHYLVETTAKLDVLRKGIDEALARMDDDRIGKLNHISEKAADARAELAISGAADPAVCAKTRWTRRNFPLAMRAPTGPKRRRSHSALRFGSSAVSNDRLVGMQFGVCAQNVCVEAREADVGISVVLGVDRGCQHVRAGSFGLVRTYRGGAAGERPLDVVDRTELRRVRATSESRTSATASA